MIKKCGICKNKFKIFYLKNNHQLYCNNCRFKECKICNKEFYIKARAKEIQKFCSKQCCGQSLKGRKIPKEIVEKTAKKNRGRKTGKFIYCKRCNKKVYKYPRDLKHSRSFCSFRCFNKYLTENASPKRNNKIKDKKWKKKVHKRNNYTCWICGIKKQLNAHHLKEWAHYPELRFDINNGITLCKVCHMLYTDYGKH